jgi:hypothetical protein
MKPIHLLILGGIGYFIWKNQQKPLIAPDIDPSTRFISPTPLKHEVLLPGSQYDFGWVQGTIPPEGGYPIKELYVVDITAQDNSLPRKRYYAHQSAKFLYLKGSTYVTKLTNGKVIAHGPDFVGGT